MPKDANEVGAMWTRKGPKGEFYSGMIDIDALAQACAVAGQDPKRVQIVMFRNQFTTTKSGKAAPTFRILHDTWKPGQVSTPAPRREAPPADDLPPAEEIPF